MNCVLFPKGSAMRLDSGSPKIEHIKDVDSFIEHHDLFLDTMIRVDKRHKTEYRTLPTYIRNAICHPNSERTYSEDELHKSIEFLRLICFELNSNNKPE